MANVLDKQKQQAIIHLLVEGNSIRSIERLTGVHRDTIMRLAVKVGGKCKTFLNAWQRNLKLRHVQVDEIWTFVGCKQHNVNKAIVRTPEMGDQFLYVAFDQDTKLIATFAIGKRNAEVTQAFMYDLADRIVTDHPQLSSDGWQTPWIAARRGLPPDANCNHVISHEAMRKFYRLKIRGKKNS